jgi:transposase
LIEQQTRYRSQLTTIEDVLFPELKEFFKASITSPAARHLLEAFPTPRHVAAAEPGALGEVVVNQGRARTHAGRMEELQMLARDSAGLVGEIGPILEAQVWLLRQLHLVETQITGVEQAIDAALHSAPAQDRAVLSSLPGMTVLRQAVLLTVIGDLASFRNDRQLRKLLGWYPESKESGSSTSKHRLGQSGNRMARREIWLWVMLLISPKAPPTAFRLYYQGLRQRGVAGRTAIGHVAGKLISVLFYCMRNGQPYDPVRHLNDLGSR